MRKNQHNCKAEVPFAAQIGREFGISKSYAWRILAGERNSPLQQQMRTRQAELLAAAAKRAATKAIILSSNHENKRVHRRHAL